MAYHVSLDGQVANIDLNLASDDEAVLGVGPLRVQILEFVNGWIEEGGDCEGLLHGAFDESVRQCQSTR